MKSHLNKTFIHLNPTTIPSYEKSGSIKENKTYKWSSNSNSVRVERDTRMKSSSKWVKKRITDIVKPLLFLLINPHSNEVWGVCRFYVSVLWVYKLQCHLFGEQCHHSDKSNYCWFKLQIERYASDE